MTGRLEPLSRTSTRHSPQNRPLTLATGQTDMEERRRGQGPLAASGIEAHGVKTRAAGLRREPRARPEGDVLHLEFICFPDRRHVQCCRTDGVENSDASEGLDLRDANYVRSNDIEAAVPEGWGSSFGSVLRPHFRDRVQ